MDAEEIDCFIDCDIVQIEAKDNVYLSILKKYNYDYNLIKNSINARDIMTQLCVRFGIMSWVPMLARRHYFLFKPKYYLPIPNKSVPVSDAIILIKKFSSWNIGQRDYLAHLLLNQQDTLENILLVVEKFNVTVFGMATTYGVVWNRAGYQIETFDQYLVVREYLDGSYCWCNQLAIDNLPISADPFWTFIRNHYYEHRRSPQIKSARI